MQGLMSIAFPLTTITLKQYKGYFNDVVLSEVSFSTVSTKHTDLFIPP